MQAYGTFTKIGDYIYRTDTYLQFGDSENLIGACVLCNPGSAELGDKNEMKKLIEYNDSESYEISGELKVDPAMRQLIEILEGAYGKKLDGIFRIYNLFTLRNSDMKSAINCIKDNVVDPTMVFKDYDDFANESLDETLVLTAWGVSDLKLLRDKKYSWLKLINKKNSKEIGKLKEGPHYYHPTPHSHDDKKAFVRYIIDQYKAHF